MRAPFPCRRAEPTGLGRRRLGLPAAALLLLPLLVAATAVAEPAPDPADARRAAANRALSWLDAHLLRLPEFEGTPKKPFTFAAAGLAYLMAPAREGAPDPLPRIVSYLERWLRHLRERVADPEELPPGMGAFGSWYAIQYTWPVAQSMLFFGELRARGLYPRKTRRALAHAEALLLAAQHESGGWGHHEVNERDPSTDKRRRKWPSEALGVARSYPPTLVSSSATVAMGLAACLAATERPEPEAIPAARRYFVAAQLDNGNFPYDPSQRTSHRSMTGVSRTGSALLAMYWLGFARDDPRVERSLAFVLRHQDYLAEAHGSPALNLMQSAWALKLYDDEAWASFRATYYPRLLAKQSDEGDLACICEGKAHGTTCDSQFLGRSMTELRDRAYVTALHAIILLLEDDRLQIGRNAPRPAPRDTITAPTRRKR